MKTRRGFHLYFQHRDGLKTNARRFDRKIDIRTTGGYVCAPTSPGYSFLNDAPIIPASAELIAALTTDRRTIKLKAARNGDLIVEGTRNDSLFRIGCGLQGAGYSDAEIGTALHAVNAVRVMPPLASDEVEAILQSVSRYPKGRRSATLASAPHRTAPGYYLCRAIKYDSLDWKDRRSHCVQWEDIATGKVYRQFFNHHHPFPPRSKAVINYFLLFSEFPKRLDRVDFTRFVGSTAIVQVVDSKPTDDCAKDVPGLVMPDGMIESRVSTVICSVPSLSLSTTREEGEER